MQMVLRILILMLRLRLSKVKKKAKGGVRHTNEKASDDVLAIKMALPVHCPHQQLQEHSKGHHQAHLKWSQWGMAMKLREDQSAKNVHVMHTL